MFRVSFDQLTECLKVSFDVLFGEGFFLGKAPAATSKSPTCGRVKIPHPVGDGTGSMLALGGPFDNPCGGFFQSPAFPLELEQVTVVHQAVEQGGYDDDVPEQFRPVLNHAV